MNTKEKTTQNTFKFVVQRAKPMLMKIEIQFENKKFKKNNKNWFSYK